MFCIILANGRFSRSGSQITYTYTKANYVG